MQEPFACSGWNNTITPAGVQVSIKANKSYISLGRDETSRRPLHLTSPPFILSSIPYLQITLSAKGEIKEGERRVAAEGRPLIPVSRLATQLSSATPLNPAFAGKKVAIETRRDHRMDCHGWFTARTLRNDSHCNRTSVTRQRVSRMTLSCHRRGGIGAITSRFTKHYRFPKRHPCRV